MKTIGTRIDSIISECLDYSFLRDCLEDEGFDEDEVSEAIETMRKLLTEE